MIGGGYVWKDVYELAAKHGHIAVGGDDKVRTPTSPIVEQD